jgi:hypothetical protein
VSAEATLLQSETLLDNKMMTVLGKNTVVRNNAQSVRQNVRMSKNLGQAG